MSPRIVAITALVSASCAEVLPPPPTAWPPEVEDTSERKSLLSFRPEDLTTGFGASGLSSLPVRLSIDVNGLRLDQSLVDELISVLRLRKYPTMQAVPFEARGCGLDRPFSEGTFGLPKAERCAERDRFIELHPVMPLEDGWMVASLERVPIRTTADTYHRQSTLMTDEFVARFRVDSAPTPAWLMTCFSDNEDGIGMASGALMLSESIVDGDDKIHELVSMFAGVDATCTFDVTKQYKLEPFSSISFSCVNVDEANPWKMSLADGLASTTGAPLRSLDGATPVEVTWKPNEMREEANGCRRWRPTW